MTAPALLRQLAQPALNTYANTVTVTVPTRLLTALADQLEATPSDPADVARRFHEAYEELAPAFGYETRKESAVPWQDVPIKNRQLMIAVATVLTREAREALAEVERAAKEHTSQ